MSSSSTGNEVSKSCVTYAQCMSIVGATNNCTERALAYATRDGIKEKWYEHVCCCDDGDLCNENTTTTTTTVGVRCDDSVVINGEMLRQRKMLCPKHHVCFKVKLILCTPRSGTPEHY